MMMSKICIKCGSDIHPKRVEILPNTKTCVKCSDVQPKRGEVITKGTGDHTWTETIIFDSIDDGSYLKRDKYEFTDTIITDEIEETDNVEVNLEEESHGEEVLSEEDSESSETTEVQIDE